MESEWQVDPKTGERYRMIGKIKEYEMMVHTSGCVVPASELADFHKRQKEAEVRRKAAAMEEFKNRPEPKYCPFVNGVNTTCKREKCVLFYDNRCSIAILADVHGTDQPIAKGAKCPFSPYSRCDKCALNNGGCGFVKLAAATNK